MTTKATDPFDASLQEMSDEDLAAWSFGALVRQLLLAKYDKALDSSSVEYAQKILEAGAKAMSSRGMALDPKHQVDFFGDLEFLIEGALRLGALGLETRTEPDVEGETIEERFLDKGRPGHVARLLQAEYANDPISSGQITNVALLEALKEKLAGKVTISPSTLYRARRMLWPQTTSDKPDEI